MSGETAFRTKTTVSESKPSKIEASGGPAKPTEQVSTTEVPSLYLDYENSNGEPYSVSYFGLGDTWSMREGGFPEEIAEIEGYFRDRIENGDMANSINAVKDRFKEILKVTGMNKEERNVIRIGTVAEYIKFLKRTDDIKHQVKRYGNT